MLFLTDQERSITHFPPGWSDENLPGLTRLKKNGLSFNNAFTAACMCTPARTTLLSGYFPAQSGSHYTLETDMPADQFPQVPLRTPKEGLTNIANVMTAAGYDFVYKGKLHVTKPAEGATLYTPEDAEVYGFTRWDPQDAGANQDPSENGGPPAYNDDRFINQQGNNANGTEGALQYLDEVAATSTKPFFLVVSLVNPHDVLAYPNNFYTTYNDTKWLVGDIELPATVDENITYPNKPSVQKAIKVLLAGGMGTLNTTEEKLNYINFYGNLMKYSDDYLVKVLDKLDAIGKTDDTVVIRSADHGEMGLAHGGLRQKNFVFYEEAINIPLLYSNPVLFPKPVSTNALVSHVDFVPTLATLFSAPASAKQKNWAGKDYSKVILDPSTPPTAVQDYVVFQYGDIQSGQGNSLFPKGANQIVSIREIRYKLAKYFDPNSIYTGVQPQYEMYDLKSDPNEFRNIASPVYKRSASQEKEFQRLKKKLEVVVNTRLKPLPLKRSINIFSKTRNVQNNATFFLDQSVKNQMSGVPIGTYSNCSLYYFLNPKKSTASLRIEIQGIAGAIRGVGALTYSTNGTNIKFTGKANFTGGTGAYRDIKAYNLNFTDTNTVSGQQGRVNITGFAFY